MEILSNWLNELLIGLLVFVAISAVVLLRRLERAVFNGLTDRVAKTEGWITWLVQDRIVEARAIGRRTVKPPPDIDTQELEIE